MTSHPRVLITGGTGELGSTLVPFLGETTEAFFLTRSRGPQGVRTVFGRLENRQELRAACQTAEVVLHLAGKTHARTASEYRRINAVGTANILEAALGAGVRRFVYMSTRAVGHQGGGYAASKAEAEALVKSADIPWVILRPAEVYGAGGDDPITALAATLARRPFVPLLGRGDHRLAPVHAVDVARATVRSLSASGIEGRTYTLAGPESLTYEQLVSRLEEILGIPRRPRVHVPLVAARWAIACASRLGIGRYVPDQIPRLMLAKSSDSSAAREDLGFSPRTLEEGLGRLAASPEFQVAARDQKGG